MKYLVTWKFIGQAERSDEWFAVSPFSLIGFLCGKFQEIPPTDFLKFQTLEYLKVERRGE